MLNCGLASLLLVCSISSFLATESRAESTLPSANKPASKTLIMGVFPRRNATQTIKAFTPIADYLSEQLGMPVILETSHDFQTFWNHVQQQRYDIVHFNQYHFIRSSSAGKYTVIAQNEEFGKKSISSAILVRKDSGINNVEDLRGKKIIFGGNKQAMIAYIANTSILRKAGLNAGDYEEFFAKNPPNSVLAVYYKQADAVGAGDVILDLPLIKNLIDISKLKIVVTGKPLPHLPWAVKTGMPPELQHTIQHALVNLSNNDKGKIILKAASLSGIHLATDKQYSSFRELLEAANKF